MAQIQILLNHSAGDDEASTQLIKDPIKQLFTSVSDKINCEIHSLEIMDLLLTNVIAKLKLVVNADGVDVNPTCKQTPHVPMP